MIELLGPALFLLAMIFALAISWTIHWYRRLPKFRAKVMRNYGHPYICVVRRGDGKFPPDAKEHDILQHRARDTYIAIAQIKPYMDDDELTTYTAKAKELAEKWSKLEHLDAEKKAERLLKS